MADSDLRGNAFRPLILQPELIAREACNLHGFAGIFMRSGNEGQQNGDVRKRQRKTTETGGCIGFALLWPYIGIRQTVLELPDHG
jgi:hypothetical protein